MNNYYEDLFTKAENSDVTIQKNTTFYLYEKASNKNKLRVLYKQNGKNSRVRIIPNAQILKRAIVNRTLDIDLRSIRLNVHRTLTTGENYATIMGNTTKTYARKRILPIPDFIYPYIIEQMQFADAQINNEEKLLFKPNNKQ